jgi:hypothetical protein
VYVGSKQGLSEESHAKRVHNPVVGSISQDEDEKSVNGEVPWNGVDNSPGLQEGRGPNRQS